MKLTFELKALTPIHIGSGEVLQEGLDYIRSGSQVGFIDLRKLRGALGDELFGKFVGSMDGRQDLWSHLSSLKGSLTLSDVSNHLAKVSGRSESKELRQHIRTGFGQLYIPGSSVKGSWMGSILADALTKKLNPKEAMNVLRRYDRQNRPIWTDQEVTMKYLGSFSHSIGRFLRFSDVHFDVESEVIDLATFNSHLQRNSDGSDWSFKPRIRQWVEVIPAGSTALFELGIGTQNAELYRTKRMSNPEKPLPDLPAGAYDLFKQPEEMLRQQNAAARRVLNYESEFFDSPDEVGKTNGDQEALDNYRQSLQELMQTLDTTTSTSCMLQVGFGQGWNSITGGWIKDGERFDELYEEIADTIRGYKYQGLTYPKTRKINQAGTIPGWIQLTLKQTNP